ncbi:hypothetical protein MBM_00068 [Drepanopeziza brunnea f. sp. 'multigermtubi' MB_m1]|uniref:Uncharacterized protein n=2 Tax=Drepanopeziza brunnea f. sp. 'multigermtubi' TaxID=698441 RepID=K1WTG8_MARBU|nr:uncharacterized protein MBM_00068 [Drepanopeziza brunnea f. sp. 'multigermtubi' MB_m1]EKD20955.1 hypothetical protein MBM_00068 [Drepanopeziza brunnea f. sp. 'multigermtubi' MB_m1]
MDFLCDGLENLAVSAAYEEPDSSHVMIKAAALIGITKIAASKVSTHPPMPSPAQARTIYLLKLDGPLSTPAKVQAAAKLQAISESHVRSSDDDGNKSLFCKLDGRAELAIESWLSARNEEFRPLFVTLGRAYEELSSSSLYPTLGIYTILLQFRPQDAHLLVHAPTFGYAQDQFPVWYFYGRLASAPKLCSLLSLPGDEVPVLHKPSAMGGKMETGGNGKYNALVYGPEIVSRINGWAYQVASEEHEDALRKYETAAYEVFKCEMEMHSNRVQGCISRRGKFGIRISNFKHQRGTADGPLDHACLGVWCDHGPGLGPCICEAQLQLQSCNRPGKYVRIKPQTCLDEFQEYKDTSIHHSSPITINIIMRLSTIPLIAILAASAHAQIDLDSLTSAIAGGIATATSEIGGALDTATSVLDGALSTAISGASGALSTATGAAGSAFTSATSIAGGALSSGSSALNARLSSAVSEASVVVSSIESVVSTATGAEKTSLLSQVSSISAAVKSQASEASAGLSSLATRTPGSQATPTGATSTSTGGAMVTSAPMFAGAVAIGAAALYLI